VSTAIGTRGAEGSLRDAFLARILTGATRYRRAVGFFSSDVFRAAPDGFKRLLSKRASFDLVCSPILRPPDIKAIAEGVYNPEQYRTKSHAQVINDGAPDWHRTFLSWAIARGVITIQVAVPEPDSKGAIYHEKFGIVYSPNRTVVFEGSANETYSAYVRNFERVLLDETPDGFLLARYEREFDKLWSNSTPTLRVLPVHDAFREGLVRAGEGTASNTSSMVEVVTSIDYTREVLIPPVGLDLRPYQREAINAWFEADGCGVLALATGTGKTFTALSALCDLYERVGPPLVIIIVAPLLHLADQWIQEAHKFGLRPIRCAEGRSRWHRVAYNAIWNSNHGHTKIVSLVATNATFSSEAFKSLLDNLRVRTVIIGDEVHNLGAARIRSHLPERVRLRMGLSATPKRWMDEDGTEAIRNYFGNVVTEFTIRDAITCDPPVLSPYTYHPVLVELDPDEAEEYLAISRNLARSLVDPDRSDLSDEVLALLLRRARLLGSARNKIPRLREVIHPFKESYFNLVYCGDGSVELETAGMLKSEGVETERQITAVTRLLGHDLSMGVATYTATTSATDRQRLLAGFRTRRLQALVCIRCLDEGIDIPEVRRAFILASGTNPRQFIQRRGRLLRRSDGKEKAEIYDFIVLPPGEVSAKDAPGFPLMRKLLDRELSRVTEFTRDALNGPQAREMLLPTLRQYQLLHV